MAPKVSQTLTIALSSALAALAGAPAFTPVDAVKCEWERRPPVLTPEAVAALSPADRARLELTLQRIGAPGAAPLLPPWLANPTAPVWEAKALEARTPQDRFTALHFLNRLKSTKALTALEGLTAKDAATWPLALHLEGQVATARLNGCELSAPLQGFLDALATSGKSDPVRAGAARLRLILAGKEKGEPRMQDPNMLAFLDAWNRGPWEPRAQEHLRLLTGALASTFSPGPAQRLLEGLPGQPLPAAGALAVKALDSDFLQVRIAALEYFQKLPTLEPGALEKVRTLAFRNYAGPLCGPFVAVLRKHAPKDADRYDAFLLGIDDPLSMAAALEDLPHAPANLEALVQRLWKTSQYDAVQAFLPALERWKLPEDQRRALLARFLEHPCWTARLDAYTLLVKVVPATPWPNAPKVPFAEEAIHEEALRLARVGKPVKMRITFQGGRRVMVVLDAANAPINVANLVLLARRGFYNDHTVPRVVPDFVVQMGSPCDTMDGGPGYTVRCEDSLTWYGPGSVGMALSGKDTGGSQFFITTNATPHLTGRYTRVGEVEDPGSALPILDGLELGTKIVKVEIL
jgi:cyclophilin family peptidyl-prolyl cis-trans isomerase